MRNIIIALFVCTVLSGCGNGDTADGSSMMAFEASIEEMKLVMDEPRQRTLDRAIETIESNIITMMAARELLSTAGNDAVPDPEDYEAWDKAFEDAFLKVMDGKTADEIIKSAQNSAMSGTSLPF